MTFNIYNLDDNHNPINCGIFTNNIDSIVNELKYNNKGYHLQLRPDKLYTVFGDLDDVKSEDDFKKYLLLFMRKFIYSITRNIIYTIN